jgi:hypothetical protein
MHWIPPLGESTGGLFIGVVRGSGNSVQTGPLTTPFTQIVQSRGQYSHFTLLTTLHGAYHMMTCIPSSLASVRYAALIFSSSRPPLPSSGCLLNDDLRFHEHLNPPFGSCAHRPVKNHKIRRFVHESMHADVNRT